MTFWDTLIGILIKYAVAIVVVLILVSINPVLAIVVSLFLLIRLIFRKLTGRD